MFSDVLAASRAVLLRAGVAALLTGLQFQAAGALPPPGGGGEPGDPGGSSAAVPDVEWLTRQSENTGLAPYDLGLLGDQIDLNSGSLSFTHVDVSLPGNSNLPVAFVRTREAGERYFGYATSELHDWLVDVPRIRTMVANPTNQSSGTWTNRCNFMTPPPVNSWGAGIEPEQYWNGFFLELPGQGSQRILQFAPTMGGSKVRTVGFHAFECISMSDGDTGLRVTAPDGVEYRFDELDYRTADPLMNNNKPLGRRHAILMATEVTDVHGNWVRYEYDSSHRPTRIHANDGREITIAYSGSYVSTVSANGRTWTYTYDGSGLDRVTLPDGRYWEFELGGNNTGLNADAKPGNGTSCLTADQVVTVRHPGGVTGTFTLSETRHGRTYVPSSPLSGSSGTGCRGEHNMYQRRFDAMSVSQRTLAGPSYPSATWTYSYSGDDGAYTTSGGLADTKWVDVTDPTGARNRHFFNRVWGNQDGLETRVETWSSTGALLQTVVNTYEVEPAFGGVELLNDNTASLSNPRHLQSRAITIDGATYTTTYTRDTNRSSSTYSYGNVLTTSASSTLGSGTRSTVVTYDHLTTPWILGLPTQITRNGTVFEAHNYNADGQRTWTNSFGVRTADYSYNADGTYAWVEDALNRRTSFSNYHRGIPRTITLPDSSTVTGTVDNNGWVTSVTNARGFTTSFSHNTMGWLTNIDRPAPNADTSISYSNLGTGIIQTVDTGSVRTRTTHNGFHQPILVMSQALSGGGGTRYVSTSYDALLRPTFTSLPSLSSSPTAGASTSYDALGRVTQVSENVAPYATTTTAYLSGNRTQVTDPLGNVTITTASGFGGPGDGAATLIQHPMGLSTAMTYDIWGNLLTARQYGSHNGYTSDHTQSWIYDSRMRLCRHSVPETGDTLYAYDNANQVTALARGQSAGSACASSLPGTDTIVQVWDNRGRLDQVLYPDSAPDMNFGYDANGNMTSAVRGTTSWTYTYNNADAITSETLNVDGLSFTTSYTRNANGYVTNQVLPGGRTINYNPDGFGRAKRIRSSGFDYASSGSYHVSGALQSYNMGNGRNYSATFNSRHQMTSQTVGGSSTLVDFDYLYNAGGQIIDIDDNVVSGQDRAFTYDGLGRLATASGPWGSGSFTYDPLGNLRRQVLGSRTVDISYNSLNRVSQVRDTARGSLWDFYSYDSRGNVTSNDQLNWTYDRSEQPVSMSGTNSGSFVYDAHRRRVKQVIDGETIYSVYSQSGSLIFRRNHTTGEETDYLRLGAGGRSVARVVDTGATETVTYTHTDHLGSPVASTSASGALLWREDYTPFGEARQQPAANDNDEGYTGHINDSDTGIVYMQARYYDPAIGRFLSGDPVGFASGGPAYFNRYAYVMNNPLSMVDPTGMAGAWSGDCDQDPTCRTVVRSARDLDHFGADREGQRITQSFNSSDPNDPNYHQYQFMTVLCLVGNAGCEVDELFAQLVSITPPKLICDSSQSSCSGAGSHVLRGVPHIGSSGRWGSWRGTEHIETVVDWEARVAQNITRPNHMFHFGQVIHTVYEHDGAVFLYTLGTGTGGARALNNTLGAALIFATHIDMVM